MNPEFSSASASDAEIPQLHASDGLELPVKRGTSHCSALRVLIVEDEPLVSMMLTDIVEDTGFVPVGPAATGDEALQLAESQQPAIAIVDVTIRGDRGGIEIGALLSERHGIALIFMSGHGGIGDRADVRALRPTAVLQKPCSPRQIMDALTAAAEADPGAHGQQD